MAFDINRGKVILRNWDTRQRELEGVGEVQGDLSKGIKREKYLFLRDGLARLASEPTIDEKIYAGIIRAMLEKLRKEFFPNPILRTFMQWKERLIIMPQLVRHFQQEREANFGHLDKRMNSMGITGLSDHLRSQLDYERERIDLPISSRFEQNAALELTLVFERKSNDYQLTTMEATLLISGEFDRKCTVPERYGLHVNHAINLLKGGAVKIEQESGQKGEKWLQLDFEYTDEKTRFPLRELLVEEGHGLDKILSDTAKLLSYSAIDQQEVLEILKTGAQAVFSPDHSDIFYLEANPRDKGLIFRDENQRVIPIHDLKTSLTQGPVLAKENPLTIKKLELSKSDHAKQNGLER